MELYILFELLDYNVYTLLNQWFENKSQSEKN